MSIEDVAKAKLSAVKTDAAEKFADLEARAQTKLAAYENTWHDTLAAHSRAMVIGLVVVALLVVALLVVGYAVLG